MAWGEKIWTKKYPELLSQWDYEANTVEPENYGNGNQNFYWHCRRCQNRWPASLNNRIKSAERVRQKGGELCPFCGKRRVSVKYNLAVCYPEISRQFASDLNHGLQPQECFPVGNKKVWWRCDFDPSHTWKSSIASRTQQRSGCPHCAKLFKITYTSRALFYYLRQAFPDCVCEYPEGRYHIDICIPSQRIAIEHHGYTHWKEEARRRDLRRREELLRKGYRHVLWLAESPEPISDFILEEDILTYYNPNPYKELDRLICYVLRWLEALTGEILQYDLPNIDRDHQRIENAYYHERRQRSLAVCYPELAKEWSSKNNSPAEAVLAESGIEAIWVCSKCGEEFPKRVVKRTQRRYGCPVCSGKHPTKTNNAAVRYPHLLADWDTENNDKTLYELLPSTKYLAAWKCHICGHRWKTLLPYRAKPNGSRCKSCGFVIPTDTNNLAVKNPALAAFWDPTRNGIVTPARVAEQSDEPRWWRCGQGHVWKKSPKNMKQEQRWFVQLCPYCRNDIVCVDNCLETVDSDLAAQWHPTKNGNLTPQDVTGFFPKGVWWVCNQGHTFRASVYNRYVKHAGCPFCMKLKARADECLAVAFPQLAEEWHPTKNGGLTPWDVKIRNAKKVWWICKKNHEWTMEISKRSIRGQGCPYCSGRRASPEYCLAVVHPDLRLQWNSEKNEALTPWNVTPGSKKKVWWRCDQGHEWEASISNRRKGRGCPKCWENRRKIRKTDV